MPLFSQVASRSDAAPEELLKEYIETERDADELAAAADVDAAGAAASAASAVANERAEFELVRVSVRYAKTFCLTFALGFSLRRAPIMARTTSSSSDAVRVLSRFTRFSPAS